MSEEKETQTKKKVFFELPTLHLSSQLDDFDKSEGTPTIKSTETPKDDLSRTSNDFLRPSLDFERPMKNIQTGAKVVQNLLKRSKKLFLPKYENESFVNPKQENKEEKKILGKIFISSRRSSINSAFLLLLLLMTRLGSYLISGNNLLQMYGDDLMLMTGWKYEDLEKYISYSYCIASIITYALCLLIGFTINFILPPLRKLRNNLDDSQLIHLDFFISQLRYPTYFFLISLLSLAISHILFMFGLFYQNVYMIIIFRSIFGGADALVASKVYFSKFSISIIFYYSSLYIEKILIISSLCIIF